MEGKEGMDGWMGLGGIGEERERGGERERTCESCDTTAPFFLIVCFLILLYFFFLTLSLVFFFTVPLFFSFFFFSYWLRGKRTGRRVRTPKKRGRRKGGRMYDYGFGS